MAMETQPSNVIYQSPSLIVYKSNSRLVAEFKKKKKVGCRVIQWEIKGITKL